MNGGTFFFLGTTAILGWVGWTIAHHDQAVVPGTVEQVGNLLSGTESLVPRKDGDGNVVLRAGRLRDNKIPMWLQYSSTAPQVNCHAELEPVSETETRVTTVCGDGTTKSALQATTQQLSAAMFNEHIRATLAGRPFDRKRVDDEQIGVVFKNLKGMQREALKTHDEMQALESGWRQGQVGQ
ncbi:MAG: hypothetical protein H2056_08255 [Sphingopyxis sp.]|nr:hypothetical protein [Sphingopyxis sp.]